MSSIIKTPWQSGLLAADYGAVRPEYAAGTWFYAVGTPAFEHPRYQEAVDIAHMGGWNPWWIRSLSDVMDGTMRRGGGSVRFVEAVNGE